ncbi:hypothetical protein L1049_023668 [Liquidambar formosana]|uniref:Oligopeptide transporter n=1 Tax=Liquidambar formosana TaxID=63359 RepID=A0AAP0S0H1_LIQFO
MERMLPKKFVRVPGTKWIISMNPGPFNQKEHALISVFANTGNILPQAVEIIIVLKTYYHKKINLMVAMMIALSTQLLGYGFAGLFMKFLVDSPYMWTLHETEKRPRGLLTRLQFFTVAFVSSFAYYIVPGYLFPSISALSFVCWIWKDSVIAHQLGAGRNGLGIGSFGLDWQTITGYTSDPLVTPPFAINNIMIGFIIAFYIITPIAYWTNSFEAKRFPIFSSNTFDIHGQRYNVSNVIKEESFTFDENGYNSYSQMYMSIFRVYSYGLKFASITAALVHVALHHGKDIWQQFKEAYGDQTSGDVHSRLMKKYEPIPKWWFYAILVSMFSLAIFSCQRGLGENTELPFWVIAVGCVVGLLLVLPNAIICATTGWE